MTALLALIGLKIFLSLVVLIAIRKFKRLFLHSHGWSHRLAGGAHLLWLFVGAFSIVATSKEPEDTLRSRVFCYDIILGILGVTATLTAARDFPHKLISTNVKGQSGTLHRKAIVTQEEMIEHAFYQFLNLWQILYLHSLHLCGDDDAKIQKLFLLWIVTSPWMFRKWLPVHSFSDNWKVYQKEKKIQSSNEKLAIEDTEVFLYRIKKGQYLFYKHVILHGVNISMVISSVKNDAIPYSIGWRVFWILLNTSYVMEFFMQSMVKAKVIHQSTMLTMQRFLMLITTLSAAIILQHVHMGVSLLSLLLNFIHRHHDLR